MIRRIVGFGLGLCIAVLGLAIPALAVNDDLGPVVLLSIDGLKPDHVLEADKHGLKIPHLRQLARDGVHAKGVIGVTPTVTYPSHATMVTGVSPAKHGILTNTPFDPLAKNLSGWYWYAEDIKMPTLWDVAAKARVATSAVDWPTTVGANITYNIAQYWRASTPDDHKILRAVSTPGLLAEAEGICGAYPEGNDYTVAADKCRTKFNVFVLERKRPRFHLAYFSGLDTEAHRTGPYSRQTLAVLEQIDELVGQLRAAAEKAGSGRAVFCVVSDHGFSRTDREIHLNAAFAEAGLIQLNEQGRATSWNAFAWYPSGTAGIMLRDPSDAATRDKVRAVLDRIATEHPEAGLRVLTTAECEACGGFPGAAFIVAIQPPYRFGSNLRGAAAIDPARVAGTHGYLPTLAEMDASFFLAGPGIPAGESLGRIDMRDIAPTLAGLLRLRLPTAEGRDLLRTRAE